MKKISTIFAISLAILAGGLSVSTAAPVNCSGVFLLGEACRILGGAASNFTFSGLISSLFVLVISVLVLYILYQIIKAVFTWVGKSQDEKARGAAIKSITNAIIAGIVLIIALLVVLIGAKAFGLGEVVAINYGCYDTKTTINSDGTITAPASPVELSNSLAIEGTPDSPTSGKITNSDNVADFPNIYCKDTKASNNNGTGSVELSTKYKVGKRLSVK